MKFNVATSLIVSTIFLGGCSSYTNMNASYDKSVTNVEEAKFIDKFEISPVHIAVKGNDYKSVKSLINKGANVNVMDFMGDTPLIDAVKDKNKSSIAKLLLCNGAKKDVKDVYNLSPLDYAEKNNDEIIVKMLKSSDLTEFCKKTEVAKIPQEIDEGNVKFNLNISFDFDSAEINNSFNSKIKEFADFMKYSPSVKGKIEAHTDSIGSNSYNQKLSEKRAEATIRALEAQGIDRSRLTPIGYGEMNPKASNETEEGRAQNRRVEATIY